MLRTQSHVTFLVLRPTRPAEPPLGEATVAAATANDILGDAAANRRVGRDLGRRVSAVVANLIASAGLWSCFVFVAAGVIIGCLVSSAREGGCCIGNGLAGIALR